MWQERRQHDEARSTHSTQHNGTTKHIQRRPRMATERHHRVHYDDDVVRQSVTAERAEHETKLNRTEPPTVPTMKANSEAG